MTENITENANAQNNVVMSDGVSEPYSDISKVLIDIINLVTIGIFASMFSIVGIVGNIVNIVVFAKQGLRTPINICFMCLSISDLCSLFAVAWFCICVNPYFNSDLGLSLIPSEVQHLTAGFPHACFARITAGITVFMTAERCLCITFPFTIRQIITPRRSVLTIVSIYIVVISAMVPEYVYVHLGWKFDPVRNTTLLGLVFISDMSYLEGLTFLLYSILMLVSFIAVVLITAYLIVQLKRQREWRSLSVKHDGQRDTISRREKMAIVTVLVVACVFILTFTPTVVFSVLGFAVPGFSVGGKYKNMFFILANVAFAFDAGNASVGILLYYTMNSSYKQTLQAILLGTGNNNT